ncbi:MAG: hypothetical protein R2734_07925 [Nocardioides sp.]
MSALLDGAMSPAEEERAWAHVHACHLCRDQVEREGWVKTQLATLSLLGVAPSCERLKGALLGASALPLAASSACLEARGRSRAATGAMGGALGVAVLGLLALGAAPASAPVFDGSSLTSSIARSGPAWSTRPAGATRRRRRAVRPASSRACRAALTGLDRPPDGARSAGSSHNMRVTDLPRARIATRGLGRGRRRSLASRGRCRHRGPRPTPGWRPRRWARRWARRWTRRRRRRRPRPAAAADVAHGSRPAAPTLGPAYPGPWRPGGSSPGCRGGGGRSSRPRRWSVRSRRRHRRRAGRLRLAR